MRARMRAIIVAALFIVVGGFAFAQTDTESHDVQINVVEVAMLDLNNLTTVVLSTQDPANAGDAVSGSIDNAKRMFFTSLASGNRTVDARISAGSAPAGTGVSIVASNVPAGCGTASAAVTLTGSDQSFITGIGSCHTGLAPGITLTYQLVITDETQLSAGDTGTVTVMLTLTDDV